MLSFSTIPTLLKSGQSRSIEDGIWLPRLKASPQIRYENNQKYSLLSEIKIESSPCGLISAAILFNRKQEEMSEGGTNSWSRRWRRWRSPKVEGWPVPGEGVVGPVQVRGLGGGRVREAGGGVYSGWDLLLVRPGTHQSAAAKLLEKTTMVRRHNIKCKRRWQCNFHFNLFFATFRPTLSFSLSHQTG